MASVRYHDSRIRGGKETWNDPFKPVCGGSNGIIVASERGQSARPPPPRKRAYLNGYREFESPPLRQLPSSVLLPGPLQVELPEVLAFQRLRPVRAAT